MNRLLAASAMVGALLGAVAWSLRPDAARDAVAPVAAAASVPRPLAFERNDGQTDPRVRFVARGAGGTVFVAEDGMTIAPRGRGRAPMRLAFDGAVAASVDGDERLPGVVHYLRGRDPSRWRTDVPLFARAVCREVWPGIDVVFHGDARRVEYDFELSAGADPGAIALRFDGADSAAVGADGDLVVRTGGEEYRHQRPRVFQDGREIDGEFAPAGDGRVGFRVRGHDPARAFVIDPVIAYATYLGGSDSEPPTDVAVDAQGNVYVTGSVSSVDFPVANPLPGAPGAGGADAYVSKLNPSGAKLLYSTYFGGGGVETGWGVRADSSGIYVAGSTTSPDFPAVGAIQAENAGGFIEGDAFLVKLARSGDQVLFSTLLGGARDDGCRGLAVDASGTAWLGGFTNSTNFPTTAGAAQRTLRGAGDAWAAKIDRTGAVLAWATYFGGASSPDEIADVAVDAAGNLLVAGFTASFDLPAAGGFQAVRSGGESDGFVAKLDATGAVTACTYLGGSGRDACRRVAVDAQGRAYVAGFSVSPDFPRKDPVQVVYYGGAGTGDAFVTSFEPSLAALAFSTFLGGGADDDAQGLALAPDGSVFVAGSTTSLNFPSVSPVQAANGGDRDAFVAKLAPGGTALEWSTYYGGPQFDNASAIAVDGSGDAYVAMSAGAPGLPALCAAQPEYGGGAEDCHVVKLTDVASSKPATPLGAAANAATPYRVDLTWTDTSRNECGFRVERREGAGEWTVLAAPDTNATALADAAVAPDRTYTYRVFAVNPLGESDASDEVSVTTPQTITISQRTGRLTEANASRRDRIQFKALLRVTAGSADGKLRPPLDGVEVAVGSEADPVVVVAAAADRRWRKTGKDRHTWTSPPKTRPQVRIDLDLVAETFKVTISRLDFPTTPNGAVYVSLRTGDDAGHTVRGWTPQKRRPGRFKLP